MTNKCVVCGRRGKPGDNVSFHRFPDNVEKKQKWLKALKIENAGKWHYVCSRHFAKSDYKIMKTGIRNLKSDAIPTLPGSSSDIPRFPKDGEQRNLWFSILGIDDEEVLSKQPELCSDHFDPRNIIEKNGRKYVKPGALPELNPPIFRESSSSGSNSPVSSAGSPTRDLPNINDQDNGKLEDYNENDNIFEVGPSKLIINTQQIGKLEHANENYDIFEAGPSKLIVQDESIISIASFTSSSCTLTASEQGYSPEKEELEEYSRDFDKSKKRKRRYVGDLSSSDFSTPKKRRRSVNLLKTEMYKKRRKIHSLQMRVRRLNLKIKSLQAVRPKSSIVENSESAIKVEEDDALQSKTNKSAFYNPVETEMSISNEVEKKHTPYTINNVQIKEEIDKDKNNLSNVQCLVHQSGSNNEQGLEENDVHSQNLTENIKNDELDHHGNVRLETSNMDVQNTVEDFPKDEWYYFGVNISCQLRSLPFERALACQKKFIDMLTQERLEEYLKQMKSGGTETGNTE